jgi:uncharacterized protein (DUF2141 family)
MEFDLADVERAVGSVRARLAEVPAHLAEVQAAVAVAVDRPMLPDAVVTAILQTTEQVMSEASRIATTLEELLEGAAAPVTMFADARGWIDIKGKATDVQGTLRVDQLPAKTHWKGLAADRYATAVTTQSGAAGRIAAVAGSAAAALSTCAGAALLFYVALGVIVVQLIGGLVAAGVALLSQVFSWAGLLGALAQIEVTGAQLVALVTALTALLGAQALWMINLRGELVDHSQFPGGHWPNAVADTYADATVVDGDAKWSVTT